MGGWSCQGGKGLAAKGGKDGDDDFKGNRKGKHHGGLGKLSDVAGPVPFGSYFPSGGSEPPYPRMGGKGCKPDGFKGAVKGGGGGKPGDGKSGKCLGGSSKGGPCKGGGLFKGDSGDDADAPANPQD